MIGRASNFLDEKFARPFPAILALRKLSACVNYNWNPCTIGFLPVDTNIFIFSIMIILIIAALIVFRSFF